MITSWATFASGDLISHLTDSYELDFWFLDEPIQLPHEGLFGIPWLGVTKQVVFLWIAGALMILLFTAAARDRRLIPGRLRNVVESILTFLRDELIIPYMGEDGLAFMPFVATVFFFILFCNLLGLIPEAATATGNISVTAALALVSFAVIQGVAARHGPIEYLKTIVPSVPLWLWPLLLVVELSGFVAKTVALTVRLFANMTAGHAVLFAILGLAVLPAFQSVVFVVGPIAVLASVGVYFLEIFVAFLQAFVFTFLTVVFIGEVLHSHH